MLDFAFLQTRLSLRISREQRQKNAFGQIIKETCVSPPNTVIFLKLDNACYLNPSSPREISGWMILIFGCPVCSFLMELKIIIAATSQIS